MLEEREGKGDDEIRRNLASLAASRINEATDAVTDADGRRLRGVDIDLAASVHTKSLQAVATW